jgi:hypothetical protein
MPAPPSKEKIINAALVRLGNNERITSIDQGTNTAARFAAIWDLVRRALLNRHPWNFAISRAALNAAATAPAFGWDRQFQLPQGCLRWLGPARGEADYFEAEREGDYLLTDAEAPLNIRYIVDHDDVTRWSAGFVEAMTHTLAGWVAEGVTQSGRIAERADAIAAEAVRIAKRIDGLESTAPSRTSPVVRSDWLAARNRPWTGR